MEYSFFFYGGLILLFVSVFFLCYFWYPKREVILRERTGLNVTKEWNEDVTLLKWFYPLVLLIHPITSVLPISAYRKRIEMLIVRAGLDKLVSPNEMISLQLVMIFFVPLLLIRYFDGLFGMVVCAAIGAGYPLVWLVEKKKKRQEQVLVSFPYFVDMLSLSVEAGLDFNNAIMRLCEQHDKKKEPLIDEFLVYQRNLRVGQTKEEALKKLADRIGLQDIYSFVSVLLQAEKMGASVSDVLKEQAVKLRKERFLRAEKAGAEASQKMLVPMMIFIFPLLFFIVLGPYVVKFILNH